MAAEPLSKTTTLPPQYPHELAETLGETVDNIKRVFYLLKKNEQIEGSWSLRDPFTIEQQQAIVNDFERKRTKTKDVGVFQLKSNKPQERVQLQNPLQEQVTELQLQLQSQERLQLQLQKEEQERLQLQKRLQLQLQEQKQLQLQLQKEEQERLQLQKQLQLQLQEQKQLQLQLQNKEQERLQLQKQKSEETAQIKEQFTEKLSFSSEKEKLSIETAIAKHELQLRTEFQKTLELEKAQIEDNLKREYEAEKQKLIADLRNLKDSVNQNKSERSQIDKLYDAQKQRINQLLSEKSDLENQLAESANLDVHQRIAQLRSSIESEYEQKKLLALEEAKTEAAAMAAQLTAEMAAQHTKEILTVKNDAREQVKKEVNIVTQNLKREIQEKMNIIRDKDVQLMKAYDEVGVDVDEQVPFTTENVKWVSFTVIALAAAIIFSKFESTMFKALFPSLNENWGIYACYFILAIVLQLLGVYVSVNYNRKETQVEDKKTGKLRWVVTIEKYPIYVIVAMDIIVEGVGFVWDFFDRDLEMRFIIGATLIAIILPVAHYFSSHIILEHLRKKIQERLNYGL